MFRNLLQLLRNLLCQRLALFFFFLLSGVFAVSYYFEFVLSLEQLCRTDLILFDGGYDHALLLTVVQIGFEIQFVDVI